MALRGWRPPIRQPNSERGSAMVEFCSLALLLMVPLVYVVLAIFRVQAGAYGITAAAREAGRAFVTASDPELAERRARAAAALVAADQGLTLAPGAVTISCSTQPCLTPDSRVVVRIETTVRLPFLPAVFAGRAPASIALHARHTEVVDLYRTVRPAACDVC
jgi:Flp pilus assembly protein TadG